MFVSIGCSVQSVFGDQQRSSGIIQFRLRSRTVSGGQYWLLNRQPILQLQQSILETKTRKPNQNEKIFKRKEDTFSFSSFKGLKKSFFKFKQTNKHTFQFMLVMNWPCLLLSVTTNPKKKKHKKNRFGQLYRPFFLAIRAPLVGFPPCLLRYVGVFVHSPQDV